MKAKHILIASVLIVLVAATALWLLRSRGRSGLRVAAGPAQQEIPHQAGNNIGAPATKPAERITTSQPANAGQASVTVGDKTFTPENFSGHFQMVEVGKYQVIPVEVSWPENNRDTDVLVCAVDGGKIDGGDNGKRFSLQNSKTIRFSFDPNGANGRCQVLLRRGTKEEVLQFWVPTGSVNPNQIVLR